MRHRLSIRELPGWAPFLERDPSLLPRVFRSPSPNHGERMIGKRYMRGCTKNFGPGPESESGQVFRTRSQAGFSMSEWVRTDWMSSMSEWPRGTR